MKDPVHEKMKKILLISIMLFLVVFVSFAKPISHASFRIGPFFSPNGVLLSGSTDFSLDFWIAHVESKFSIGVTASNNTLVVTPNASEIFKYVDFNWKTFRVEYGATGTLSSLFPTAWDVGEPPIGWTITLAASAVKNALSFSADRGSYIAKYKGPIFIDAFWYKDSSLFTVGTSKGEFFLNGGNSGDAYFIGVGGKLGNLSMSFLGFSNAIDVFPNLECQIPSRYAGIFEYDSEKNHAILSITENEFSLNDTSIFKVFGGSLKVGILANYTNETIPYSSLEAELSFEKYLGGKLFFLKGTYGKTKSLWGGMELRF